MACQGNRSVVAAFHRPNVWSKYILTLLNHFSCNLSSFYTGKNHFPGWIPIPAIRQGGLWELFDGENNFKACCLQLVKWKV